MDQILEKALEPIEESAEEQIAIEEASIDTAVRSIQGYEGMEAIVEDAPLLEIMDENSAMYESWMRYWEDSDFKDTVSTNYSYDSASAQPHQTTITYEMEQFEEAKVEVKNKKWAELTGAAQLEIRIGTFTLSSQSEKHTADAIKQEQRNLWRQMNFHWTAVLYDIM